MDFIKGKFKQMIFESDNGYKVGLFRVKEASLDMEEHINKTITFTYSTNSYTVTIVEQADNGTALGTYTLTEKYGTSKTISPNTYTGYTSPAAQKIKWNSNKTVTFTYTANIYTVTFDGNGGSTPASIQVTYGGTFGKLPTCTRDYYTFDGWYTAANGGKKVKSTTAVSITSNLTL